MKTTHIKHFVITILVISILFLNIPIAYADSGGDWVSIHVTKVTLLHDNSGDTDRVTDFRLLMIAPHQSGRTTYYAYPGENVIPLSKGESAYLGESGLSLRVPSNATEISILLLGVDRDQLPAVFDYATDSFIGFASKKIAQKLNEFLNLSRGSVAAWLAGEAIEVGATTVYEYLKENDVLGERVLILPRSENWFADGNTKTVLSTNGDVEFSFEVRIAPDFNQDYSNKKNNSLANNNISAEIEDVWIEHNVYKDNKQGMDVHVKFVVNEMKNRTGDIYLIFRDEYGDFIEDPSNYDLDGVAGAHLQYSPPYDGTRYNNFVIFYPYDDLQLPYGENKLDVGVVIFDDGTTEDALAYDFSTQITITSSPPEVDAEIESVWVDHGVYQNDTKGMLVHTRFHTTNMKDIKGYVVISFYYKNGNVLKDTDGLYSLGNQVVRYSSFTPPYIDATYDDFKLFIPYDQFHITKSGTAELKFVVEIYNSKTEKYIGNSNTQYITYTK